MNIIDQLKWKKYQVGSGGFICLVDAMGDDSSITQAARISYGAGTKSVQDDANLIRYLYRHGHLTPFEMVELKWLIRCPMDVWRQWIRHRTANVNEYSTRYSVAIEECARTDPTAWRLQKTTNKQGSEGTLQNWDEVSPDLPKDFDGNVKEIFKTPGDYLSYYELAIQERIKKQYEERLEFGIAREQARKDLPLSTYTEAYWKCDLRNIFNFLSLRMDDHAQLEIREYANAMYEIVKQVCPAATAAFDEYDMRRGGLLLTATELKVLSWLPLYLGDGVRKLPLTQENFYQLTSIHWKPPPAKSRERDEALAKFIRMELVQKC